MARNLMEMQNSYPEEYDFFPETFVLPADLPLFKRAVDISEEMGNKLPFIVKPSNDCQGRGIHLVRKWSDYDD